MFNESITEFPFEDAAVVELVVDVVVTDESEVEPEPDLPLHEAIKIGIINNTQSLSVICAFIILNCFG
ncbi:MAG TPA: hypothetical protein DCO83_08200 [Mucilaginibacter sp.]|jgi:hypothetical protein|nr:hypothetical protein [Mucilaginibacter sp.]